MENPHVWGFNPRLPTWAAARTWSARRIWKSSSALPQPWEYTQKRHSTTFILNVYQMYSIFELISYNIYIIIYIYIYNIQYMYYIYIYIDSYHLKISEDPIFFQGFRNNRSRYLRSGRGWSSQSMSATAWPVWSQWCPTRSQRTRCGNGGRGPFLGRSEPAWLFV